MKKQIVVFAVCVSSAFGADSTEDQLAAMRDAIRQMQTQHQQEIDELKKQVINQQSLIETLQQSVATAVSPPLPADSGTEGFPTTDTAVVLSPPGKIAPETSTPNAPAFPTSDTSVVTAPESAGPPPITIAGGGKTFLNISFDALIAAAASSTADLESIEVGDHDPIHRGFNARNLELVLDGAVDPYLEGFANIVFKLDPQNETGVEVEEAFAQTTSLPWNLQVKAGQFFAPFGRINAMHPHVWDFADAPLVSGRLLGPDGLRGVGAQVSWIVPLPWLSQLLLAAQNGEGGTGFAFRNTGEDGTFFGRETIDRQLRGVQDLVFVPRLESSFDFGPTQTLLFGLSGAFGPNDTGSTTRTQIYAIDAFYKWKPANAGGGWPFFKWQTELMHRRFEAGRGLDDSFPESETFDDWGAYSQVVWGFTKGWAAGLRGDYLHMDDSILTLDPERRTRWRLSANVTWYPSEFSKLRLQYNHDFLDSSQFSSDRGVDSVFLQLEFALGAHGAHKF